MNHDSKFMKGLHALFVESIRLTMTTGRQLHMTGLSLPRVEALVN